MDTFTSLMAPEFQACAGISYNALYARKYLPLDSCEVTTESG